MGSLAFLGLLIVILCVKPFGDSNTLNPEDTADQELPIQFQPEKLEDLPLPPANTRTASEETTKESQSKGVSIQQDVEEQPSDQEVSIMPANIDSV